MKVSFFFSMNNKTDFILDQLIDRHEQIEIIRQKQQKLYEEQINQFEQRKKQVFFLLLFLLFEFFSFLIEN